MFGGDILLGNFTATERLGPSYIPNATGWLHLGTLTALLPDCSKSWLDGMVTELRSNPRVGPPSLRAVYVQSTIQLPNEP